MKRIIIAILITTTAAFVCAQGDKRKPENHRMTLARVIDVEDPTQPIFVINGAVAFKTVNGLKEYLKDLPKGSSLTWAPGCCRFGDESIIGSTDALKEFEDFCEQNGINFVLVPSG